jgi:hypothetical protein
VAISATIRTELVAIDSAPALAGLSAQTLQFDAYNTSATISPTGKKANCVVTLTAGAATLDLTAVSDPAGTQNFNGLKVQAFKIRNTSATVVTISKGGSNGYALSGTSAFTIPIPPAYTTGGVTYYGEVTMFIPEFSQDVDGTHKTIDFAGSGTESLQVTLIAG